MARMAVASGHGYNPAVELPRAYLGPGLIVIIGLLSACSSGETEQPVAYSAPTAFLPEPTPESPTDLPPPSATPPCSLGAIFLQDLTVSDGERVSPGQVLDKRWEVRNAGSCDWGPGYRLVRVDAGPIEGGAEIALFPARAGETAMWQVSLVAPEEPGEYLASWQARSPEGTFFGDQVFILIEVIPGG